MSDGETDSVSWPDVARKLVPWLLALAAGGGGVGYADKRIDGLERRQEMILELLMDQHPVGPQREDR